MFSFGLALTIVLNLNTIFILLETLLPNCCIANEGFESHFYYNILANKFLIMGHYLLYIIYPTLTIFLATALLKKLYSVANQIDIKKKHRCIKLSPLRAVLFKNHRKFSNRKYLKKVIAVEKKLSLTFFIFCNFTKSFINDSLVNYMGQMTAYKPNVEQLFVDVLDQDDSLYSGIYSEYLLDQNNLAGLKLTNVIRYSFKGNKDRFENSTNNTNEKTRQKEELPYILPNNGEMFFPAANIKNLHFWKLQLNHKEIFDLSKKTHQIRFIWFHGLTYSLPRLNIKSIGYFLKNASKDLDISLIFKSMNILKLNDFESEILKSVMFDVEEGDIAAKLKANT